MNATYDAIKEALNTAVTKAVADGLPINPYMTMLSTIPKLRQKASDDDQYDRKDKTVTIIQMATLQSSKIDFSLSDRLKVAEIVSGASLFSNYAQNDAEGTRRLETTRAALNDLLVLCDNHNKQRLDLSARTPRLEVDALKRAYSVSVESDKQWGSIKPDFFIHLVPQVSRASPFDLRYTGPSSGRSIQTSDRETEAPRIATRDLRFSAAGTNAAGPNYTLPNRDRNTTGFNLFSQRPTGGLFSSNTNGIGVTPSSDGLFGNPNNTSPLFPGLDARQARPRYNEPATIGESAPVSGLFSSWPLATGQNPSNDPTLSHDLFGTPLQSPQLSSRGLFSMTQGASRAPTIGLFSARSSSGAPTQSSTSRLSGTNNPRAPRQASSSTNLFNRSSSDAPSTNLLGPSTPNPPSSQGLFGASSSASTSNFPPSQGLLGTFSFTSTTRPQSGSMFPNSADRARVSARGTPLFSGRSANTSTSTAPATAGSTQGESIFDSSNSSCGYSTIVTFPFGDTRLHLIVVEKA